jgi:hypothetical protein
VTRETPVPDLEVRNALLDYRTAYDVYFMSKGNNYAIRNVHAKHVLQAAEQGWHDFMVRYLAARGRLRPDWAFEPLPGFDRVNGAPAPPPVPAPRTQPRIARARPRAATAAATVPRAAATAPSASAPLRLGSHLRPIAITNDLGVVDISDDDDEDVICPRKRARLSGKFMGVVDLMN